VIVAALGWIASSASAQTPSPDSVRLPLIDEVRFGALVHSIESNNSEDGVDLNLELLFRRAATRYNNAYLDALLRPRVHLGASINTAGNTSQLYAGLTWDMKLASEFSLELTFGGAMHDGPTDRAHPDSYGCTLSFRESVSLGYILDERWTVYGTLAHMSNAGLCDDNTGVSSAGVRFGYKLQ
jgi:hypothetical protein